MPTDNPNHTKIKEKHFLPIDNSTLKWPKIFKIILSRGYNAENIVQNKKKGVLISVNIKEKIDVLQFKLSISYRVYLNKTKIVSKIGLFDTPLRTKSSNVMNVNLYLYKCINVWLYA